jgi:transcription factor STE12
VYPGQHDQTWPTSHVLMIPTAHSRGHPMSSSFYHDSSTHSSPRSYPADLDPYYPSQSYPVARRSLLPPTRSSSYTATLQVTTSTSSHEHDPNERTARPGNAHHHLEFHEALGASTSDSTVKSELLTNGDGETKDYTSSTPGLTGGLTRPLKPVERERLAHLDRLKFFLATAPSRWDQAAENAAPIPSLNSMGEDVDDLAGAGVATPTPPSQSFMSGTVPYGPGSFGSTYPSTQYDSSSAPSTSSTSYRNTFTSFSNPQSISDPMHQHLSHLRAPHHPALNRFLLPNHEYVTCVLWNGLYHISGTDIVRALVFRFEVS